jgi:hypothetical protein
VRIISLILLVSILAAPCLCAPGNTAAGLAGVGAGAALGAGAGQAGATTPGGAGGAGGAASTAPIEVQIMAYKGLAEIAEDIATLTEQKLCEPLPPPGGKAQKPAPVGATKPAKTAPVIITGPPVPLPQPTPDFPDPQAPPAQPQAPVTHPNAAEALAQLEIKEDGKCPVDRDGQALRGLLLEDPTSALDIALYQSLVGYHDQLASLHSSLIDIFSLIVKPDSLTLLKGSPDQGLPITLSALDATVLTNLKIAVEGPDRTRFVLSSEECAEVSAARPCTVNVTFVPPTDIKTTQSYSANLKISSRSFMWNHGVNLQATWTPPKLQPRAPETPGQMVMRAEWAASGFETGILPTTPTTPATGAAAPAAGAAAASPLSLTYLSGIGTALTGIKAGISYSSASLQPTTQSFQVLVEGELQKLNIRPYTSTSPLELTEAAKSLSALFGDMLMWGAQIDFWNNACKPADPTKISDQDKPNTDNKANKDKKKQNPECTSTVVTTNLAAATQLMTGYTALLTNASDGNGNPVIADVLRGWVLSDQLKGHMDSLQLNVAAAAGSTRTNAFFLVNLFYLPKPSYNAGVIATFELRNGQNDLLRAGARTAFYDYNKNWKGTNFDAAAIKESKNCAQDDTFCIEKK